MTDHPDDCPRCEGTGEIQVRGESLNPFSGIRSWDPQEDRSYTCSACDGSGVRCTCGSPDCPLHDGAL